MAKRSAKNNDLATADLPNLKGTPQVPEAPVAETPEADASGPDAQYIYFHDTGADLPGEDVPFSTLRVGDKWADIEPGTILTAVQTGFQSDRPAQIEPEEASAKGLGQFEVVDVQTFPYISMALEATDRDHHLIVQQNFSAARTREIIYQSYGKAKIDAAKTFVKLTLKRRSR